MWQNVYRQSPDGDREFFKNIMLALLCLHSSLVTDDLASMRRVVLYMYNEEDYYDVLIPTMFNL